MFELMLFLVLELCQLATMLGAVYGIFSLDFWEMIYMLNAELVVFVAIVFINKFFQKRRR